MSSTTLRSALALVAGLWLPGHSAAQLAPVESLRPLMLAAIRDGYAEGAYDTPDSRAFFVREFGTGAALEYRVRRVALLEGQSDCARLEVNARQVHVLDRNADTRAEAPRDMAVTWRVNYCADGSFPETHQ